jgi:hypothetical protein
VAIRIGYVVVYGGLAALGAALLARPAGLWTRSLGLWAPTLPWRVPAGWAAALLLAALTAATARLAAALALRKRLPRTACAAFLAIVAAAGAVRSLGEPAPSQSADAANVVALRRAADLLDASYASAHRYHPDLRELEDALRALPPPGFVSAARPLRFTARIVDGARGPQRGVRAGDPPGTVYVAISPDGQSAWLCATTLRGGSVGLFDGTVEARAGTHSDVGGDAAFPVYPGTTAELR